MSDSAPKQSMERMIFTQHADGKHWIRITVGCCLLALQHPEAAEHIACFLLFYLAQHFPCLYSTLICETFFFFCMHVWFSDSWQMERKDVCLTVFATCFRIKSKTS